MSQLAIGGSLSALALGKIGHFAALLGLFWALVCAVGRRRFNEQGRLTASHPAIVVGQFLCLACCMFATLVSAYFMVSQFSLAAVHTWSYTVLSPESWVITDMSGVFDLLCVGLACLVMTYSTKSGYLILPLFWSGYLAVVWQCLTIPPVAIELNILPIVATGSPSLWLLTLLVCSALMLSGLVIVQGLSWKNSRRRSWQHNVEFLTRPARSWPGLKLSVACLGLFIIILSCVLLVFPSPAGLFRSTWCSLLCAAAAFIASLAVLVVANRHWVASLGTIGLGLMSLSICFVMLSVIPRNPPLLSERFPLIFTALISSCALCTLLWMWLAGVWQQQLDDEGRAWTTAGRMIPIARQAGFSAGAFGVLFALQMSIWPILGLSSGYDNSLYRVGWGSGCLIFLIVSVGWAYLRTGWPVFRLLTTLSGFALLLFGFMRVLPYTALSY